MYKCVSKVKLGTLQMPNELVKFHQLHVISAKTLVGMLIWSNLAICNKFAIHVIREIG